MWHIVSEQYSCVCISAIILKKHMNKIEVGLGEGSQKGNGGMCGGDRNACHLRQHSRSQLPLLHSTTHDEGLFACSRSCPTTTIFDHSCSSIRPLHVLVLPAWLCWRVPDVLQQDDRGEDTAGPEAECAGEQLHGTCVQSRRCRAVGWQVASRVV